MIIEYTPLGGAKNVGKSSYIYRFGGDCVSVDWGGLPTATKGSEQLTPQAYASTTPSLRRSGVDSSSVVAHIATHGHFDHVGRFLDAMRKFKRARAYMTPATWDFAMHHSNDLIRKMSRWEKPLFVTDHITAASCRTTILPECAVAEHTPIELAKDLSVQFFRAGHTLGSVSLLFNYRGHYIFHSGDCLLEDQAFAKGAEIPHVPDGVLFANIETTNVNENVPHAAEETKRFLKDVIGVVERGGFALLASLSIGRVQELWSLFYEHQNELPINMEHVIIDGGMANKFCDLHEKHTPGNMIRWARRLSTYSNLGRRKSGVSITGLREEFLYDSIRNNKPAIIIASGGGLQERSAAREWVRLIGEAPQAVRAKSALFFSSFLDQCSVGGEIARSYENDTEFESVLKSYDMGGFAESSVKRYRISAHIRTEDFEKMCDILRPRLVSGHHGDGERVLPFLKARRKEHAFAYPRVGETVRIP